MAKIPVQLWLSSEQEIMSYSQLRTVEDRAKALSTTSHGADMTSCGWVRVGEGTLVVDNTVLRRDLRPEAAAAIDVKITLVQAEAERVINQLRAQKQELLALPAEVSVNDN